jgi:outer membrane cobalamin receptor
MQSSLRFVAALTLVLLVGCTKSNAVSSAPNSRRDLITREQIESLNATDAYDIVQRLRSDVLRGRGSTSVRSGPILAVVYIDGVRRGGPEILRQLRSTEVEEIRFISGNDATTRWGTDHGGGVIDIKTRSGR